MPGRVVLDIPPLIISLPQGLGGLRAAAGPAGPRSQGSLQVTCLPTCPPAPVPGPQQDQLLRSLPCKQGQSLLGMLSAGSDLLYVPVGSDMGCDFCSPIQTGFSPEHLGVTKESPWRASHLRTGSDCYCFHLFLAELGLYGHARASHCGISSSLIAAPRPQAPWLRSCDSQAYLLCGGRDLPGSGAEPGSPALAGGSWTTGPPGSPDSCSFC